MPLVGFLPAGDPRMLATLAKIERELVSEGMVRRYPLEEDDGLPGKEGAFIACTLWLADVQEMVGRTGEARATFERVLGIPNDVGPLSEEYDVSGRRLVGNFPQAFSPPIGELSTVASLLSSPSTFEENALRVAESHTTPRRRER